MRERWWKRSLMQGKKEGRIKGLSGEKEVKERKSTDNNVKREKEKG